MVGFTNEDADDDGLFFAKKSHTNELSAWIIKEVGSMMMNNADIQ